MENEEEVVTEVEETPEEKTEVVETEEKEEAPVVEKPKETPEQKEARLERQLKQVRKQLGKDEPKKEAKPQMATGELDEAQLDYFELKGIVDDEKIAIIQNVMKRTGLNHRDVLKDEYVISKFKAMDDEAKVKNATPSGAKRSGGSVANDVDYWYAKYEKDGTLPSDFELASKVINKKVDKDNPNKPAWRS